MAYALIVSEPLSLDISVLAQTAHVRDHGNKGLEVTFGKCGLPLTTVDQPAAAEGPAI